MLQLTCHLEGQFWSPKEGLVLLVRSDGVLEPISQSHFQMSFDLLRRNTQQTHLFVDKKVASVDRNLLGLLYPREKPNMESRLT